MKPFKNYQKVYTPSPKKNILKKSNHQLSNMLWQYIVLMYAVPESHILF